MSVTLVGLIGRQVVAVDTAAELGPVGHVAIDPPSGRVVALAVGKGRKGLVVSADAVRGLAGDVVTVSSVEALREPADDAERALVAGDRDVLRRRVLTTSGYEVGSVADCELDDDGVLVLVRTTQGEHPGATLRGIGSYAVVVDG